MLETQLYRGQFRDGSMTDSNNLAAMLQTTPEIMDHIIYAYGKGAAEQGIGSNYGVLQYLTQGRGATGHYEKVGNDQVQWPVVGKLMKAIMISGAASASSNCGIGFTKFTVPMAERYFSVGHVCRFEDDTLCRVTSEPFESGNSWVYEFQIIGSNPGAFVQQFAVAVTREVALNFSGYEEGSHGGGSVEASPSMFKNQLTIMRLSMAMTGSARTDKIVMQISRPGFQPSNVWWTEKQWQFMHQWYRMQESLLWSSRYNRLQDGTFANKGVNGRPVKFGSGVEEQLAGVNTIITSELQDDMLWHMLISIRDSAPGAEKKKLVLVTGNGGCWEFHKALKNAARSLTIVDTHFVHDEDGSKLAFGGEFVTFKGPDGMEFTVVNHPLFNDTSMFPARTGPYNYTKQSYKMFFLNMSNFDGIPNIRLLTKGVDGHSRQMQQWFVAGATTPDLNADAPKGTDIGAWNTMRAHDGDYYSCHILSEIGVAIMVPNSCGMIQIEPPTY